MNTKKTALSIFASLWLLCAFSQQRMVLNNNSYIVLSNSVYLVIENSNTNAITTTGTGGNIVSEGENNKIRWNVANNTGTYVIPYTTTPASQGGNDIKIPLTVTITNGGAGAGQIDFSTYETTTDGNTPFPTGVTNMNNINAVDVSLKADDRFWIIDPNGYTTPPTTTTNFGYDDSPNEIGLTNTITESKLTPHRFESGSNAWIEHANGVANIVTNRVNAASITSNSTDNVWTIIEPPCNLVPNPTVNNASCFGGRDGSASMSVSGGGSPYTYLWSNGSTTTSPGTFVPGTYSLTVSDNTGCTVTTAVTISQPPAITLTTTVTDAICGSANGVIATTTNGGTTPYNYTWNDPTTQTTATATGLVPGTYNLVLTDANGCLANSTNSVSNTVPNITVTAGLNVSCNGNSNGSGSVVASGGLTPYSYLWTSGETSPNAVGLAAGTNFISVTDANSCVAIQPITTTEPSAITVTTACTNVSTVGGNDGSSIATASGGTAGYTYLWDAVSNNQTTATATGLSQGTPIVTVTDANGCSTTAATNCIINDPSCTLTASITVTNANCNGNSDGTAAVTPIGGTTPYTYQWSNSLTTPSVSGLATGSITATITDNNLCVVTQTGIISEPTAVTISTTPNNVNCNGGTDGSATVSVNGGTTPYTYSWTNNMTTSISSGLTVGVNIVTVTDAALCSANQSVTITEPTAITVTTACTDVTTVGGSDGNSVAMAMGGTTGYTYLWNTAGNNQTTATATGLSQGSPSVTVTDVNGCIATAASNCTVSNPVCNLTVSTTTTSINCNGGSDGTATAIATNGTTPYTYVWINTTTDATASGLIVGITSVTVTDAVLCVAVQTATVSEPIALNVSTACTDVSTVGGSDGNSAATATGGTSPYFYTWNTAGGNQTTATATALSQGSPSVTVTDANGCSTSTGGSCVINDPSCTLTVSTTATNISCNGSSNGTITTTVTGATTPITYAWSNGGSTADLSNLSLGANSVTVTDANGCSQTSSANITEPSALTISTVSVNAICGAADGSITSMVTGGSTPYTYLWDDANNQTTAVATALLAGTYIISVADVNNCTITATDFVTNSTPTITVTTNSNINCAGNSNGSATVGASGGVTPYLYLWSNGETTGTSTGLSGGNNLVSVTDNNLCLAIQSITISEPTVLSVTTACTDVSTVGGSDGISAATVAGGTIPYTYVWNAAGGNQTTTTATGLSAGAPGVIITDANGCTATTVANCVINDPSCTLTASVSVTDISCNGNSNGIASVSVTGGAIPLSYMWTNGATTTTSTGLAVGANSVTITDFNGCVQISSTTITEPLALVGTISTVDVNCAGGTNGGATATLTGGTTPYAYLWSNGATTVTISSSAIGISITATDANMCSTIQTGTITEPTAINVSTNCTDVTTVGGSDGNSAATVSGGISPYSYLWNIDGNNQTTATASGLSQGNPSVTVIDGNGCSAIANANCTINEPSCTFTTTISAANVNCNGGTDGTAVIAVSGGITPFTYSWTNGSAFASTSGLSAGVVTATITDNSLCIATQTITITEPLAISVTTNCVDVTTIGGSDGSSATTVLGGVSPYTYAWNADGNNQTTATVTGLSQGSPIVTVMDANGCFANTSTSNCVINDPTCTLSITAVIVDESCLGESDGSVSITVSGGQTAYNYNWSSSAVTRDITNLTADNYAVSVTDNQGCFATNSWELIAIEASCFKPNIYIPNMFSPDGDGQNEVLYVRGKGIQKFTFTIYDRWGEKIFETSDLNFGWNGKYKTEDLNTAVFVYYVVGKFVNGNDINQKGNITLIR